MRFPCALVYGVVSDVQNYKEFVPWCSDSKIVLNEFNKKDKDDDEVFFAELEINFKLFRETYISKVSLVPDQLVTAVAVDSDLFRRMETTWTFKPDYTNNKGGEVQTLVDFSICFEFNSSLYARAGSMFLHMVSEKMVDAFVDRCSDVLLSSSSSSSSSESFDSSLGKVVNKDSLRERTKKERSSRITSLESLTHFSEYELEKLVSRFDSFVNRNDLAAHSLSVQSFTALFLEMFCPGGGSENDSYRTELKRVAAEQFRVLDLNGDGEVDVREFIAGMSTLLKGTSRERCRFWFRCYDLDEDGCITAMELLRMTRATLFVQHSLLTSLVRPVDSFCHFTEDSLNARANEIVKVAFQEANLDLAKDKVSLTMLEKLDFMNLEILGYWAGAEAIQRAGE